MRVEAETEEERWRPLGVSYPLSGPQFARARCCGRGKGRRARGAILTIVNNKKSQPSRNTVWSRLPRPRQRVQGFRHCSLSGRFRHRSTPPSARDLLERHQLDERWFDIPRQFKFKAHGSSRIRGGNPGSYFARSLAGRRWRRRCCAGRDQGRAKREVGGLGFLARLPVHCAFWICWK
jgi:hypothetical protein